MPDTITNQQFSDTIVVTNNTMLTTATIRYDGNPIPSTTITENWVFGIVFILFIFIIIAVNRSYNWIIEAFRNLSKVRNRSSIYSKTTAEEYQSKFLLTIFSTGVISLYLYLHLNAGNALSLTVFMLFFMAGLIFLFIKNHLMNLVAYVFLDPELLKTAKENYFNIISFLGFLLYPLLILRLYINTDVDVKMFDSIAVILSLSALIFMTIKLFRIFLHKILDFFHLMLYLCTLEILPLIGMFQAYKLIIKEF